MGKKVTKAKGKKTKGPRPKDTQTSFMTLDLHIHSRYSSDGSMTIPSIAKVVKKQGLNGFAITDHNSVKGHSKFEDLKDMDLLMVPGIEVSSEKGHILGYGLSVEIPKGLSVQETVERIVEAGGMPVAAHPYRSVTGIGEKAVIDADFKVVEAFNGRTTSRCNRKAVLLASKIAAAVTGGSDAHGPEEIGNGQTVLLNPVETVDELLECIRKGGSRAAGTEPSMGKVVGDATSNVYRYIKRGMKKM
jgi:predicted metal-dependent phosphoesterase TrpH